MSTPSPTKTIGLLAYDDMQALDLAGPLDVFGGANSLGSERTSSGTIHPLPPSTANVLCPVCSPKYSNASLPSLVRDVGAAARTCHLLYPLRKRRARCRLSCARRVRSCARRLHLASGVDDLRGPMLRTSRFEVLYLRMTLPRWRAKVAGLYATYKPLHTSVLHSRA
jgi:hypothetical protein